MNLLAGSIAVVYAINGWQIFAVILIFVAAIFDFSDGFAARLLKAYSPMGKELDSLADLVSFGLAPATLLYYRYNQVLAPYINNSGAFSEWELLSFLPFIMVLASALRLAKFNIDDRQKETFLGIPTPANAILTASAIYFATVTPAMDNFTGNILTIPVYTIIMSYLLVCNIPMFSLKTKTLSFKGNELRVIFIIYGILITAFTVISGFTWSVIPVTVFLTYIIVNIAIYLYNNIKVLKNRS